MFVIASSEGLGPVDTALGAVITGLGGVRCFSWGGLARAIGDSGE